MRPFTFLFDGPGQGAKYSDVLWMILKRLNALVPVTLIILLATFRPACAGLPAGWSDADIGSPADAGSASNTNGGWTISGGGADIGGTSDQFNFASQVCNSDGSIVALVTSVQNSDPGVGWSKTGVMFRNDITAGAANAYMTASAAQGVQFQYRATAGATSYGTRITGITPPVWVQVVRSSDLFSGYYSLDGTNWIQVGTAETIPMAGPALAGLAATAHTNTALSRCTITNVTLPSLTFGIYRQLWTNLSSSIGNTLATLTNSVNNPNWPNNPDASCTHIFTNFETEINTGTNYYGQRLRAFVVPPATGLYSFWIASDDTSQLYLSASENPAGMLPIANQTSSTPSEDWTEFSNQQSALISLQAGCRYYMEARMQQGSGSDNLSVRWQLPNGVFEEPMAAVSGAGTLLIPYTGVIAPPGIFSQSSNTTVLESLTATLSVLVTNQAPVSYQWFNTNGELAGATLSVYTISNANVALDNGQVFTCVISDSGGSITSAPIALTVLRDTAPLTVTNAFNIGPTNVEIVFSKGIAAASATNVANYAFTNGIGITGASLAANGTSVILTNAPLVYGSNYTIVINNIQDLDTDPNIIASNTPVNFTAQSLSPQDIGSPTIAPSDVSTPNEDSITAAGYYIGATSDQFNFDYQLQTGNFDVSVRLASLGLSDLWAEAGLMARVSLTANSAFAAALATPGMNGDFFADRTITGNLASTSGSFPVNYPNTWLRLTRAGNVFTGFGSYDGTNWTLLGSATVTMPSQIYLGLAVASHNTNQPTTAQFVGFAPTPPGAEVVTLTNPNEPLGPSSRKTGIVISEIMWKPAPRTDGNDTEFLEIYNSCPFFQDISSYTVTCADMNFTFPPNTLIPGGAFYVLAASPQGIANVYGLTSNVFGYNGSLKHSETLQVLDEQSNVLLTVPYTDVYPWPVAASGTGHSIVLANPTYGEGDPRAWAISDQVGGTPGQADTFTPSPLRNVVINEILPHTENPAVPQFIELYNHSTASVDVSGCILTDDPATNEYVIPSGTVIGPAGFVSFMQSQFGFTLNGQGETLYFIKPDGSRVLDAVQFGAQANGISYGRWPDGANDFYAFTTNTPGTNNSPIVIGDIVINELMYDPISGSDDDQYIELYNQGTNTIDLAGWQFTSGVTFTFPANSIIGPNGYVVVGKNTANLFAHYTNLSSANTYGNYSGKLSHDGELVVLSQPESYFGTNTIYVEEDEVTYGTGGRWGQWSGGGGSSLELIDPHSNHRLAANWADSDETQKSSWVDIENTGILDNGVNYGTTIDYAQIGLLDDGECLVDNIEVDYNGSNYVSNGTFDNNQGLTGWSLQGCMVRSSLESSGYQSSYSLHIRSSDKIWTGVNFCQVALKSNPMGGGVVATLRFKARWLRGWPEPLLRLHGNWLEATGAMPVPTNLGTPGTPNSQYVTNAGPALYNVTHTPTVPAAKQPVVITAQVHDPDGIESLILYYRLDPAAAYTAVLMNDNGIGGDAIAGDGVYSATIPGQVANQVVAFYIAATDKLGAATKFPALRPSNNEPVRECVVMFGDGNPGGSFGVYHLWITQTNVTRWANLSDLSNEGNDCTFVNGTRVIYNMQGRFAGSPYHQDFTTPNNPDPNQECPYKWEFNDDDKFLGATDFNKIHQPGNNPGDDASLQREELANTFLRALGVPWLYKRLVAVYVNGDRRGVLMEDTQVPGSDVVKEHFPNDTDGFLFKMQPWFEMAPTPSGNSVGFDNESWCNLMPYTTTGGVRQAARYRSKFEMRRTPDSDNDFTNVFSLVDAANSYGTANYVANMENIANMENWMRVFAANHAAANRDSFGATTELPESLRLHRDAGHQVCFDDVGFQHRHRQQRFLATGTRICSPSILVTPFTCRRFTLIPTFLRMYWRALEELVNGPLNVANSGPLITAKYNAFIDNGLSVENPTDTTAAAGGYPGIEPWLSQAQSSIASQLAEDNANSFSVKSNVKMTNNVAYISGVAPVNVDFVWINGAAYPLTWTGLTTWMVAVPVTNGANNLSVVGVNHTGQPVAGDSGQLTVNYTGTIPSPLGTVAINEIMYSPAVPNAEYVELFNNSPNVAYDLSGWQLEGLGYTFPAGALISPGSYLVLAANRPAFAAAYGATRLVFDTFSSTLLPGQLLSLLQPVGGSNQVVAQVQFDNVLPWPTNANTPGVSLQLIDSHQDNWRVGNWSTGQTNPPPLAATPGFVNGVSTSLPAFPPLWINEVEPDNLTGITNRAGQHAPWLELFNPSTNTVVLTNLYLSDSYSALTNWAFPSDAAINPGQFLVVFADGQTNLSTPTELHTSFALNSGSGSVALSRLFGSQPQVLDYLNYADLQPDWSYGSLPDGQSFVRIAFYSPTPGASNINSGTPPASFIAYNTAGSTYTQNFDSLPDPGAKSVNTANPVTIDGITYSLANPYDFAFPSMTNASTGGLGLPTLTGWYGSSALLSRFGATDGDQTTGGQISFGDPNSSNRALGLLATSTTGSTAFGAKFINNPATALNAINVQATGELWRQSNLPKTLECYYWIDPTATAPMPSQATAYLPALNVSFPTDASDVGGAATDGTTAVNQINLALPSQAITNWPAGAALWLVWEMADSTGKAQGLAIDNLSFTASLQGVSTNAPLLGLQGSSANPLTISWPATAAGYQLYSATNLVPPVAWTLVTTPVAQTNGTYYLTLLPTNAGQFFRLVAP